MGKKKRESTSQISRVTHILSGVFGTPQWHRIPDSILFPHLLCLCPIPDLPYPSPSPAIHHTPSPAIPAPHLLCVCPSPTSLPAPHPAVPVPHPHMPLLAPPHLPYLHSHLLCMHPPTCPTCTPPHLPWLLLSFSSWNQVPLPRLSSPSPHARREAWVCLEEEQADAAGESCIQRSDVSRPELFIRQGNKQKISSKPMFAQCFIPSIINYKNKKLPRLASRSSETRFTGPT